MVGHAGGKALQDVLGKGDALAGEADFGKPVLAGIEAEAVGASERLAFGDLLDDAHAGDKIVVEQMQEAQMVGAGDVEVEAIRQGGVIAQDFMEAVGAPVHAGDAPGSPPRNSRFNARSSTRQLVRVRKK